MLSKLHLRRMATEDGPAFAVLAQESPDNGQVGARADYKLDVCQVLALQSGDTVGVVAETPEFQGLVGAGLVSFSQCCFEGKLLDYALLHSLTVHPNFRQQGVATELTQWRVRSVLERLGDDAIIIASIQKGNVGSLATARKWCQQLVGEVQGSMVRMRTKLPKFEKSLEIRPAQLSELDEIVHRQNQFYRDYNFYKPDTPATLENWLSETPFDMPFRHYTVAVDEKNNILAGLALVEQYKLVAMHINRLPVYAKLLNKFLAIVPHDGVLKQLSVNRLWYAPGQLQAAQYLWETIRWEWRDRGSVLVCFFDPRSPLPKVLRLPFWMPRSKFTFAVHSSKLLDETRLLYW